MAVLDHEGTFSVMYGNFAVPVGAGYRPGYLARPDKAGRFPTVIILGAIGGLSSNEKDLCRDFARHGMAALTLDMYRHHSGDPIEDYETLSDRRAMSDLDEVHEFLASDDIDWTFPDRLGVFGLDVGGRFALALAARRPWVKAVAVAYAPLTGDEERDFQVADLLSHLPTPVLGLYGVDDDLIATETVDEAQRRNDHGQWLVYEGAGHGFMDVTSDTYSLDAAADAQTRLMAFFTATLPTPDSLDLG